MNPGERFTGVSCTFRQIFLHVWNSFKVNDFKKLSQTKLLLNILSKFWKSKIKKCHILYVFFPASSWIWTLQKGAWTSENHIQNCVGLSILLSKESIVSLDLNDSKKKKVKDYFFNSIVLNHGYTLKWELLNDTQVQFFMNTKHDSEKGFWWFFFLKVLFSRWFFRFNWHIVDTQYHVSFRCATWWSDNQIHYEMITSPVSNCHYYKIITVRWASPLILNYRFQQWIKN